MNRESNRASNLITALIICTVYDFPFDRIDAYRHVRTARSALCRIRIVPMRLEPVVHLSNGGSVHKRIQEGNLAIWDR